MSDVVVSIGLIPAPVVQLIKGCKIIAMGHIET